MDFDWLVLRWVRLLAISISLVRLVGMVRRIDFSRFDVHAFPAFDTSSSTRSCLDACSLTSSFPACRSSSFPPAIGSFPVVRR